MEKSVTDFERHLEMFVEDLAPFVADRELGWGGGGEN